MPSAHLQARPIYHRTRDSIEAHLTVVFAALAVSRWIEHRTGWSIRRFVKTARRYRTIEIQAGPHTITAADTLPDDLSQALETINHASRPTHQFEPTRVGQSVAQVPADRDRDHLPREPEAGER